MSKYQSEYQEPYRDRLLNKSDISILNGSVLRIRDFRFKIENIKEYSYITLSLKGGAGYLRVNNLKFAFGKEAPIKIILHQLDEIISGEGYVENLNE